MEPVDVSMRNKQDKRKLICSLNNKIIWQMKSIKLFYVIQWKPVGLDVNNMHYKYSLTETNFN